MNEINEKTNTSVIDTEEKENLNEELTGSVSCWFGIFLSKTVERTRGPPPGFSNLSTLLNFGG